MFTQLIYISAPIGKVDDGIFIAAAERNKIRDITGLILCAETFFLQVLEGSKDGVNQLYANIVKDQRHITPILLRYSENKKREFPEWSMLKTTEDEIKEKNVGFETLPHGVPLSTLSGVQALSLLRRVYILARVNSDYEQMAELAKNA